MTSQPTLTLDRTRQELAFLDERLRLVEGRRKRCCATLSEAHPDLEAAIRREHRRPYGEEQPIQGLPRGADAGLIRLKREEHLLRWLREAVLTIPLPALLWDGPYWTMRLAESLRREAPAGTYPEEYWELRSAAETLRLLWRRWREWSAPSAAALRPGASPASANRGAGAGPRVARSRPLPRVGYPKEEDPGVALAEAGSWAGGASRRAVGRRHGPAEILARLWRWLIRACTGRAPGD